MNPHKITIPITPQTTASVTQDTYKIFHIPEVCQSRHKETGEDEDRGKPCDVYLSGNIYCGHTLNKAGRQKKKRLARFNQYKVDILTTVRKLGFSIPAYGWSVYFFIPIPKKWTQQDREKMHGQPHHRKPDLDNLYKAFVDALTVNDELIAQVSGMGKFWVDTKTGAGKSIVYGSGYIEVHYGHQAYNPLGVEFIDQSKVVSIRQDADYKRRKKSGSLAGKRGRPRKKNNFDNPNKPGNFTP